MPLSLDVNLVINTVLTKPNDLSSIARVPLDFVYEKSLFDPTVDVAWWDTRSLGATTEEELNVTSGLTDVFGIPIELASIFALAVVASLDNLGSLELGGATNNIDAFDSDSIVFVPPGGSVFLSAPVAGWTVVPTTADVIKVRNSAADEATYNIVVVGKSV
jgi:hypothetical protein